MATESAMANAFGAEVRVTPPETALFLVEGRKEPPTGLVSRSSGRIVLAIPGGNRVLALLSGIDYLVLLKHPEIRHIGPVSVDSDRFRRFLEMSRLDRRP